MAKGNKTGGRQKGTLNKHTAAFKDLLTETYRALEKEEGHGLLVWSKKNPTDFYRICAKLIPIELAGIDGSPIKIQVYKLPDGSEVEF